MPIKNKPSGDIPFLMNYRPYELPLGVEPIDDIRDMVAFNFQIPDTPPIINYNIGSVREDFVSLIIKNLTRDTILQVFLDYDNRTFTIRERDTNIEPRPIILPSEISNLPINTKPTPPQLPVYDFQTPEGGMTLTPQLPSAPSLIRAPIIPTALESKNESTVRKTGKISTQPINDTPRAISWGTGDIISNAPDQVRQQLLAEADIRRQPPVQRERRIDSTPIILRGETSAVFVIKYNKEVLNAYTDYTSFSTLIKARIQNVFDGKLCTRNIAVSLPNKERFQPKITVV